MTQEDKTNAKFKKWMKKSLQRIIIIQSIFNSDKTAKLLNIVKRKNKKVIYIPNTDGMDHGDQRVMVWDIILKEEKELAKYLKKTHAQVIDMVDAMAKRKR